MRLLITGNTGTGKSVTATRFFMPRMSKSFRAITLFDIIDHSNKHENVIYQVKNLHPEVHPFTFQLTITPEIFFPILEKYSHFSDCLYMDHFFIPFDKDEVSLHQFYKLLNLYKNILIITQDVKDLHHPNGPNFLDNTFTDHIHLPIENNDKLNTIYNGI